MKITAHVTVSDSMQLVCWTRSIAADIDECLGPDHGCEQDCVNTVGSYNCNCSESYELNTDEHTCRGIYIQKMVFVNVIVYFCRY